MSTTPKLDRLSAFFREDDIEWKPMRVSADGRRAMAAAYVTNRAIMDRLDAVCGRDGWRNEFVSGPDGGVLCGLSIRTAHGWLTKWDGAENTDIEPVKGGLSSAMRRAAVQWGIGRYLYDLPTQWVSLNEKGYFKEPPRIDPAFLPAPHGDGAAVAAEQAPVPAARPAKPAPQATPRRERKQARRLQTAEPTAAYRARRKEIDDYTMPKDLPF